MSLAGPGHPVYPPAPDPAVKCIPVRRPQEAAAGKFFIQRQQAGKAAHSLSFAQAFF